MAPKTRPAIERAWPKILRGDDDACWLWTGSTNRSDGGGYGQIGSGGRAGRTMYAHRLVYEEMVGPIPDGLQIDHLCKNTLCCNPAHMEPVTLLENLERRSPTSPSMVNRAKTHCKRGHPFDDANTYRAPGVPWRQCRACKNEACRLRRG